MEEQYLWENPMADQAFGHGVIYQQVEGATLSGDPVQAILAPTFEAPSLPVIEDPIGTTMNEVPAPTNWFQPFGGAKITLEEGWEVANPSSLPIQENPEPPTQSWFDKSIDFAGSAARAINPLVGEDEQGLPTWDISFGIAGDPDIPAAVEAVGGAIKDVGGALIEPAMMTMMMLMMVMSSKGK